LKICVNLFDAKEITAEDEIELCVNMSGLLRYRPFTAAEGEPLITVCYHLNNGDRVEVSANETTVLYKGKKHALKNDKTFINVTEDIFFLEEGANESVN